MEKDEFLRRLRWHDWGYQHSDDPRQYRRGLEEWNAIKYAADNNPDLQIVLNEVLKKRRQ